MCPFLHLVRNIERTEDKDQLETTDDERQKIHVSILCNNFFESCSFKKDVFYVESILETSI